MARPHDSENTTSPTPRSATSSSSSSRASRCRKSIASCCLPTSAKSNWCGTANPAKSAPPVLPFQTLEHIDEPRKEQRGDGELDLDMGGRAGQGLDQQTHLGRQQAHSFVPQGRGASTPDRRGRWPQAHLHRSALRRGRGLQHGHRDRRRDLPQGAEPPRTNRLPRYLAAMSLRSKSSTSSATTP
jgi:hypothetical protein